MKKTATIFILVIALFLCSCNTENSAQPSETVGTSDADTTMKATQLYSEYLSLERCINASTDILKGKCINIIENDDSVEYEFSVTERFAGDDVKGNIFVYVEKNKSVSTSTDGIVTHEISDILAQVPYQIGSEYYLLLTKYVSVYYDHDRYKIFNNTPFIPADNISESKIYGEPLVEHANIDALTTEEELCSYIFSCIDGIDKTDRPSYHGKPYTTATDLYTVINEADHVAKVKVQKQVFAEGTEGNKNIYQCIVTDSLTGEIKKDEVIYVTFFPNTVSVEDECILALDDSITDMSPKHYNFSSKNSLFSVEDLDEIQKYLNN